jgi:hypothetical protein
MPLNTIVIWNDTGGRAAPPIKHLGVWHGRASLRSLKPEERLDEVVLSKGSLSLSAANACHQRTRGTDAGIVHLHEPDKPPPRVR